MYVKGLLHCLRSRSYNSHSIRLDTGGGIGTLSLNLVLLHADREGFQRYNVVFYLFVSKIPLRITLND